MSGFFTTEKRSHYAGQDFRVEEYEVLATPLSLGEEAGAIDYQRDKEKGVFEINFTTQDCTPYQVYVAMRDGSKEVIATNEMWGILECIEVDENEIGFGTEDAIVSRFYEYRPTDLDAVYGIGAEFDRDEFIDVEN